jgi:Holliday junction DNA helicase RuvA
VIGKLIGYIDFVEEDYIILNVNDVGYLIFCSTKTLVFLQNRKEKISLLIETVVKEDAFLLFGFVDKFEKDCFKTLCKVSGVGNKMAMKILGVTTPEEVVSALLLKDKTPFLKASGVGDKVASRILTELHNCQLVKGYEGLTLKKTVEGDNKLANNKSIIMDAAQALENLGYQKSMIQPIILKLLEEKPYLTLESVITEVLKIVNKF